MERLPLLEAIRDRKMARSSHAYVRGSTVQFYEWLASGSRAIPEGPAVWICGDCHLGNLGPLADLKGRVAIQIRDLDQTVIGNPAHDVIRLALSLASAARGSDLPGAMTIVMVEQLVAGYEAALSRQFNAAARLKRTPKAIENLLAHAVRRKWRDLAAERVGDFRPSLPLGRRFLELSSDERSGIEAMFAGDGIKPFLTALYQSAQPEGVISLVDAAYWIKGCSSLGRLRYAAMVRIGEGKRARFRFIDIKEAIHATAPRAADMVQPEDDGARVVAGAMALSPHLGNRMTYASLGGKSVVLRELMPADLKLEVTRLIPAEAAKLAFYLGGIVGLAHGRQMDEGTRKAWLDDLQRFRSADVDAPSWLWTSVVELIGQHEAAYLEHCRRHGQERDAA